MDLRNIIDTLLQERKKLDAAIAYMEAIQKTEATQASPRTRGRKFMSPQERQLVSERMRKYWTNRRTSRKTSAQFSPLVAISCASS